MARKQHETVSSVENFKRLRYGLMGFIVVLIIALFPVPGADNGYTPLYGLALNQLLDKPTPMHNNAHWLLDIHVNRDLDTDGKMSVRDSDYELAVEMTLDGQDLSGDYLASTSNACGEAHIEGQVIGDEINWIVTYSGDCCGGAQMEFTGTLGDDGMSLSGNYEPIGTPPDRCNIWWAEVNASVME